MTIHNPNCGGSTEINCAADSSVVRILPISPDSNIIVCRKHYTYEMLFRMKRNNEAGSRLFEIPAWTSLQIYWAKE